jgi:hypothetical protein
VKADNSIPLSEVIAKKYLEYYIFYNNLVTTWYDGLYVTVTLTTIKFNCLVADVVNVM